MSFDSAAVRVEQGERLDLSDILSLLDHPNLTELGMLAHSARMRIVPSPVVTYALGGAVAWSGPSGSAPGRAGQFSTEEISQMIDVLLPSGPVDLCLYTEGDATVAEWQAAFTAIKKDRKAGTLTCSIATAEVARLADSSEISVREALERLQIAGLNRLQGEVVGPAGESSLSSARWMEVHEEAHRLRLPGTAAIPESLSTPQETAEHLLRVRELQDRTGLFGSFVPCPVGRRGPGDPMRPVQASEGKRPSSYLHLRLVAAARCALDNIVHIESGWELQGAKIGEVALRSGADDWGCTGIYFPSGPSRPTPLIAVEEIERLVRDSGFTPWPRDGQYGRIPSEMMVNRRKMGGPVLTLVR